MANVSYIPCIVDSLYASAFVLKKYNGDIDFLSCSLDGVDDPVRAVQIFLVRDWKIFPRKSVCVTGREGAPVLVNFSGLDQNKISELSEKYKGGEWVRLQKQSVGLDINSRSPLDFIKSRIFDFSSGSAYDPSFSYQEAEKFIDKSRSKIVYDKEKLSTESGGVFHKENKERGDGEMDTNHGDGPDESDRGLIATAMVAIATLVALIIWLIVGFLAWLPLLAKSTMTHSAVAFFSAFMGRSLRANGSSISEASKFYFSGFATIINVMYYQSNNYSEGDDEFNPDSLGELIWRIFSMGAISLAFWWPVTFNLFHIDDAFRGAINLVSGFFGG